MKNFGIILIIIGMFFIVISDDLLSTKNNTEIVRVEVDKFVEHVLRLEINNKVNKSFDDVFSFYCDVAKNEDIANVILQKSLQLKVPINLAFALAYVESRYNPKAVNKNKYSTDHGLFQLNSRSFPKVDYFDIKENTKYGLSYLKELYVRYKSWEVAIVMYNAGSVRNVSKISLMHLHNILKKERELDNKFNKFYYEIIND